MTTDGCPQHRGALRGKTCTRDAGRAGPRDIQTLETRRFMNPLRTALLSVAGVCLIAIASPAEDKPATTDKPDKDGFVSLFDGKDLDGWKVGANAESWKVENGEI